MAWCRIGDKPLSEPMLTQFTDIDAVLGGNDLRPIDAIWYQISWLTCGLHSSEEISLKQCNIFLHGKAIKKSPAKY